MKLISLSLTSCISQYYNECMHSLHTLVFAQYLQLSTCKSILYQFAVGCHVYGTEYIDTGVEVCTSYNDDKLGLPWIVHILDSSTRWHMWFNICKIVFPPSVVYTPWCHHRVSCLLNELNRKFSQSICIIWLVKYAAIQVSWV